MYFLHLNYLFKPVLKRYFEHILESFASIEFWAQISFELGHGMNIKINKYHYYRTRFEFITKKYL